MKKFELPEQLLSDVAAYLVRRPYIEVAELLRRLQTEAREIAEEEKPNKA